MPGNLLARGSGECFNCHTMHNSQGVDEVNPNGLNPALLTKDCVGCHSSAEELIK